MLRASVLPKTNKSTVGFVMTCMTPGFAAFSFGILLVAGAVQAQAQAHETSFVQYGGSYQLRYESLQNPYRAGARGSDQLFSSRLLLTAKATSEHLFGEVEIADSRTWLDDAGTPLGTDDVNVLEPLQFYVGWKQTLSDSSKFAVKAGRMTVDIGSRRFVARNGSRNTINAFSGVHGDWSIQDWRLQALYTLPVQQRPSTLSELDHHKRAFDETYSDLRLWGFHSTYSGFDSVDVVEGYLFGLQEDDRPGLNTRNRDIKTAGMRVLKSPKALAWDYEVEAAYQTGQSRSSTSALDISDLDHHAAFVHTHLSYQFNDKWASRMVLQADYASGDESPLDGDNNRYDNLFGSRRFEYGPTGIYGALARSNSLSPGVRWEFKRNNTYSGNIGYRAMWLAEARDAMTTSNVRDVTGATDKFVGQQLEVRLRVAVSAKLQADLGAAVLHKGKFLREAPNAPDEGDTSYWYAQVNYRLGS